MSRIHVSGAAMLAATVTTLCLSMGAQASSHREAPFITNFPKLDGTDLYAFRSYETGRDGYVTFLANYYPFQDPYGGPNYFALDDTGRYSFRIDNDGDAIEDLVYIFQFDNRLPNANSGLKVPVGASQVAVPLKNIGPVGAGNTAALNSRETFKVLLKTGSNQATQAVVNAADGSATFTKPVDFIGTKTFGSVAGYEAYARQYVYDVTIPNCSRPGRVFVGQRNEPFQINLGKVFDLVNLVPVEAGAVPGLPGIEQSPANDVLANKNVTTLALEVHSSCLKGAGNGVIGAWTTASTRQVQVLSSKAQSSRPAVSGGAPVQVSRLGMPLVNEVVIGLPDKDRFNRSAPKDDARFLTYVTNPTLPFLLDALFRAPVNSVLEPDVANLAPSNLPRNDLVAAFLTGFAGVNQLARVTPSEMLRLNTTIAPTPLEQQQSMGVLSGDLAGFPNGRRPGDDVTDIELRVAMGRLCHPLTINNAPVDLGLCRPADAPVGTVPFTDGAPTHATDFDAAFPYFRTPIPGSADFPAFVSE
ncbi:DUF4331 domain-containing protein [Steroidobacter sp.]|uniref:DUF4331 domain-containing protein n=1 Tax=Steroidobacter sp. TaxID=1978227 RepID=UPI001A376D54|nr:DUF4331 domain-containing protein [Steroidobacter sp.]MBL8268553.1 DUF4331 domain-containing protein [Steroidobacter sp.]